MKREVLILQEESANPAEVDRSEEVVQVHVEDIPPRHMNARVGHDRVFPLEPVCDAMALVILGVTTRGIDLVHTVLQQIREAMLNELKVLIRRPNLSRAAVPLRNAELCVKGSLRLLVKQEGQHAWLDFEKSSHVGEGCSCLKPSELGHTLRQREKWTHGHSYAIAQLLSKTQGNLEGHRGAYPRTCVSHTTKHGKKSVRESKFTLARKRRSSLHGQCGGSSSIASSGRIDCQRANAWLCIQSRGMFAKVGLQYAPTFTTQSSNAAPSPRCRWFDAIVSRLEPAKPSLGWGPVAGLHQIASLPTDCLQAPGQQKTQLPKR